MDATGKAVGKRVLDDNGNWTTVASLPQEVQDEIKANNKLADAKRRDQALTHNTQYQENKKSIEDSKLKSENSDLKAIIKEQGDMLAKINAKMELGAEVVPAKVEEIPADKPMTKKQKLQAEAELLGIDFEESNTIAELEELIEAINVQEEDSEQPEDESDSL